MKILKDLTDAQLIVRIILNPIISCLIGFLIGLPILKKSPELFVILLFFGGLVASSVLTVLFFFNTIEELKKIWKINFFPGFFWLTLLFIFFVDGQYIYFFF